MNTNIISIKYEDDFCPRTFNGRELHKQNIKYWRFS